MKNRLRGSPVEALMGESRTRWYRIKGLGVGLLFALLAVGSAAITTASLVYFSDDEVAPFVIEKLPLANEVVWTLALKTHVICAAVALPACLVLLSKRILRRAPRLHRWLGRVTGFVTVFGLVPSGFYLSSTARGGPLSSAGFVLSGLIVLVSMVEAVRAARVGDFVRHRRFALHVLAQLSVAVVSRALLNAFDLTSIDGDLAYLVSLWLPLLAGVGIVEVTTRSPHRSPHATRPAVPHLLARDPGVRATA